MTEPAAAPRVARRASIATSPDGQWVAIRRVREVALLSGDLGPAVGKLSLDADDVDLALIGPPTVLLAVGRDPAPRVVLYQPPYLDAVARLELEAPMRLAAITGARFALISGDARQIVIVRAAGRALSSQALELESPAEFIVGLDRGQLLFGLPKKLEVWDAVAGRPLARMQLQLPPAPRTVGPAQGHVWVTRPGSDELFVYRLSDGRPFRHHVGAPIIDVIHHPASPLLVIVTAHGLVRIHCFAHSLTAIETSIAAPWSAGAPLGQLVVGDDIALLGLAPEADEPWRVPIAGSGAPAITIDAPDAAPASAASDRMRGLRERGPAEAGEAAEPAAPAMGSAGDRLRAMRERRDPEPAAGNLAGTAMRTNTAGRSRQWREEIAEVGVELARSGVAELPVIAVDNELGALAHRLGLSAAARRAAIALYGLYLVGQPALSIAGLAHALGDWTEPLGQGDLGALAMLKRRGGEVALRRTVTGFLDGAPPTTIRIVGDRDGQPCAGAFRIARDGKSDAELEAELAAALGRIAVIEGDPDRAILEARLHGATAVAFHAPDHRPRRWPRDAGLVLVLYGSATSWIADLPALGA